MEVDGEPPSMENKLVASSRSCVRACVRAVRSSISVHQHVVVLGSALDTRNYISVATDLKGKKIVLL
jgi:hypothetical protein